ncbi:MAG: DUF1003 domain-containing protein [Armatimonadetes bacterium]|nr:DUF1003 domain-containing protein [Armatimonadota bacterium]
MKSPATSSFSSSANAASSLNYIVERNIRTLIEEREKTQAKAGFSDLIAAAAGKFAGSMAFIYLHLLWFGSWMAFNSLAPRLGMTAFDPFPFGLLTMIGSLEAIFISTFVLITQNRMSAQAEKRADLDVQISLLAEHEITAVLRMLEQIHRRLGITPEVEDLPELEADVKPEMVLEEIEKTEEAYSGQALEARK